MFRIISAVLLLTVLIGGCKGKPQKENNALQYCEESGIDHCSKTIVMIPSTGCGTCISSAIDFFKRKSSDRKYYFVFTEIRDRKLVMSWVKKYRGQLNIDLDTLELARKYGLTSEYPVILKTDQCEVTEVIIADLKNKSVWASL
jgi:hypothetical protein